MAISPAPAAIGSVKGKGVRFLQLAGTVCASFLAHNSLLRAAALSFTTLLFLVPMLAIIFAVLKGLGVQNRLAPPILHKVAAGSAVSGG
jgi:membrane protein